MLMKFMVENRRKIMDLIRMKGVKKSYKNGVTAIHKLDLRIKKGQFVFIIGPTGCGKSTLIKCYIVKKSLQLDILLLED